VIPDALRRPTRGWLPFATGVAVVLAIAAAVYWRAERAEAHRGAARRVVLHGKTNDLETRVADARANLEVSRRQVRALAPSTSALLSALDGLDANHRNMSSAVRDQDGTTSAIVDAIAAQHVDAYNDLVGRYMSSTRTVDALAKAEGNLQNVVTGTMCRTNCAAREASVRLPRGGRGTSDTPQRRSTRSPAARD
jgi:hypothetical protein